LHSENPCPRAICTHLSGCLASFFIDSDVDGELDAVSDTTATVFGSVVV